VARWPATSSLTRLLLGMGLRSFSMHPAQILAVKQEVLRADAGKLEGWARSVLEAEDPAAGSPAEHGRTAAAAQRSRVPRIAAPMIIAAASPMLQLKRPAPAHHQQQRGGRQRRDVAQDADLARVAQLERAVPQQERRAQRAESGMPRAAASRVVPSVAAGSSSTWHSSDSTPDTRPNKPMATVGKGGTRRVSSEKLAQMSAAPSASR
jgi:hypothetical protein